MSVKQRVLDRVASGVKVLNGVRNLAIDLQFGASLRGYHNPGYEGMKTIGNSDYMVLKRIFKAVPIRPEDVLVDVGCGKGRVINWWLKLGGSNQIHGIEYDPPTAQKTAARLRDYQRVKIIQGDAIELMPPEATYLYLFNPFDERLMVKFLASLRNRIENKAALRIVYYRPLYIDVIKADPFWSVHEHKLSLGLRYRDAYLQYAVITVAD